ncbi:hypothetical protein M1D89_20475 [Arthrobacter sp. D3-18]
MAERPSQKMSNQQKIDFLVDSILTGGDSMDGTNSLQFQIKHAPLDALKALVMDWGNYETSVIDQLVFTAKAMDRVEARQVAQKSVLDQIAAAASKGAPVIIDYDEIERRIAANMPTYVPKAKEGDN